MRFAVRTLLLLTAGVALLLAWLARPLSLYRAEQAVGAKIVAAGGKLRRDRAGLGKRKYSKLLQKDPHWTASILGIDVFARVVSLRSGNEATDKDFENLEQLTNVQSVILTSQAIGDETLTRLQRLPELVFLSLDGPRFTPGKLGELLEARPTLRQLRFCNANASASYLKQLSNAREGLDYLYLEGIECDDEAIMQIKNAGSIRRLDLKKCGVTSKGLQVLNHHPELETLRITDTAVNDEGLGVVAQLPQLVMLDLASTGAGDATVAKIAQLETLRILRLAGTKVSDRGLKSLASAKIKRLQHLTLTISDSLTREAIQAVRNAYPDCEILCQEHGVPMFFEFDQRDGQ